MPEQLSLLECVCMCLRGGSIAAPVFHDVSLFLYFSAVRGRLTHTAPCWLLPCNSNFVRVVPLISLDVTYAHHLPLQISTTVPSHNHLCAVDMTPSPLSFFFVFLQRGAGQEHVWHGLLPAAQHWAPAGTVHPWAALHRRLPVGPRPAGELCPGRCVAGAFPSSNAVVDCHVQTNRRGVDSRR